MTDKEFGMFVMAYKGLYPRSETFKESFVIEVWFNQLKDLEYKVAMQGLSIYAQTNKFPPTIADIREAYARLTMPSVMNESEAWALVSKAIRNGTYNSQAEFDRLPPIVQRAVGSADNIRNWASLDSGSVESVVGSNFIKTYRAITSKAVSEFQISPDLMIENKNNYIGIGTNG